MEEDSNTIIIVSIGLVLTGIGGFTLLYFCKIKKLNKKKTNL